MFGHRDEKLEVIIPKIDANKIQLALTTIGVPAPFISSNKLLVQLRSGMSPIFNGLLIFLGLLERAIYQTEDDGFGNMLIGIGLNLENPEAEAIIIAVNKKFGLKLDYSTLKKTPHQPDPPLDDTQVNYMFWLVLTGVSEKRPDGSTVIFPSHTQGLIDLLNKRCGPGFADIPFKANQLLTLQSMVYNAGPDTSLVARVKRSETRKLIVE